MKALKKILLVLFVLYLLKISIHYFGFLQKYSYYMKRDQLVSVETIVKSFHYKNDFIFISCDSDQLNTAHVDFSAEGSYANELFRLGIKDYLKEGSEIEITTPYRYFHDGYQYPIMSLRIDGHEIISEYQGYFMFMEWFRNHWYSEGL